MQQESLDAPQDTEGGHESDHRSGQQPDQRQPGREAFVAMGHDREQAAGEEEAERCEQSDHHGLGSGASRCAEEAGSASGPLDPGR